MERAVPFGRLRPTAISGTSNKPPEGDDVASLDASNQHPMLPVDLSRSDPIVEHIKEKAW